MTEKGARSVSMAVLSERREISLEDLCRATGIETTLVVEMVSEGILEPEGSGREHWRFSGMCLARARRALRLRGDLELNWAGVALALALLEEVETLRRRNRRLLQLFDADR